MAWAFLVMAGLLEIVWAVGLRATEGFTRPLPTLMTVAAMIASIGMLGLAMRTLPLGSSYAIWTGIGTVGTVIFGIAVAGESASPLRLGAIGLIMAGILALKFVGDT